LGDTVAHTPDERVVAPAPTPGAANRRPRRLVARAINPGRGVVVIKILTYTTPLGNMH
jgi:hypothetical protein